MRILISGSEISKNVLGNYYYKHLIQSDNVVVEKLKFHDIHSRRINKSLIYKLFYRFIPIVIIEINNKIFLKQVRDFRPDYILVFKGSEISYRSIKIVRKLNIKILNYNLDHPFKYFSKGSGNKFVKESIPYYNYHITYSKEIKKQLKEIYKINAFYLPFGYELEESEFQQLKLKSSNSEVLRACFIGNPDTHRAEIIDKLVNDKIKIDVYGKDWKNFLKGNSYLRIFDQVNDELYWKNLAKYRVQLNIFRPHNYNSHNMRTFEVPAIGGVMIAPKSFEHSLFFDQNSDCFFYSDYENLSKKIKKILKMSYHEINNIRKNAREKSVKNKYSYYHLTKQLLTYLKKI